MTGCKMKTRSQLQLAAPSTHQGENAPIASTAHRTLGHFWLDEAWCFTVAGFGRSTLTNWRVPIPTQGIAWSRIALSNIDQQCVMWDVLWKWEPLLVWAGRAFVLRSWSGRCSTCSILHESISCIDLFIFCIMNHACIFMRCEVECIRHWLCLMDSTTQAPRFSRSFPWIHKSCSMRSPSRGVVLRKFANFQLLCSFLFEPLRCRKLDAAREQFGAQVAACTDLYSRSWVLMTFLACFR